MSTLVYIIIGVVIFVIICSSLSSLAYVFYNKSEEEEEPKEPEVDEYTYPPCERYEKIGDSIDVIKYDSYTKDISSKDECFQYCNDEPKCNWVSMSDDETKCIIKSWDNDPSDDYVFIKLESGCPYVVKGGSKDEIIETTGSTTRDDCIQDCMNNTDCTAAVFGDECTLHKGRKGEYTTYFNTDRRE